MFLILLLIVPLLANGTDRYQSSAQVGHPEMNNSKLATGMKIGHLWNKELIRKLEDQLKSGEWSGKLEDQLKSGEWSENPKQIIDFLSGVVRMECRIIMEDDKQNTPENGEGKLMELKGGMINQLCKNQILEKSDLKQYMEKLTNTLIEEGQKVAEKLEIIEKTVPNRSWNLVRGTLANQRQEWAEQQPDQHPEWAEQHLKWVGRHPREWAKQHQKSEEQNPPKRAEQPQATLWVEFQNLLRQVEAHIKPVGGKEIIQRLLNKPEGVIKPSELIKLYMELWARVLLPMLNTGRSCRAMADRHIRGWSKAFD